MMIQYSLFFGLAFFGTLLFALLSLTQAYTPKTASLHRFQILAFSGLYFIMLCIFAFRDYNELLFKDPTHYFMQIVILPVVITALFFIYHIFLLFGFSTWAAPIFNAERLYSYFLVYFSAIGLIGSDDPAWILLLMELTGFATIGLIATQGSNNARAVAFTYLVFSSLATLLYCFGMAFAFRDYPVALVPLGSISGLVPALLIGLAFLIKLGLGPFARYLIDGQTVAFYPDFAFISTVGKLPYLIAFFNLVPNVLTDTARLALITLVIIFAVVAAILMVSEQSIRRFFAYSSLFNSALAVVILLHSDQLSNFFMAYMCYYIYISLLLYLAFSFFGFRNSSATDHYSQTEPRSFSELAVRANGGASFAFSIALLFSSGLPPFGIFVAKALGLGWLFLGGGFIDASYLLALTYLFISMVNMVAYFRAMLASVQKQTKAAIEIVSEPTVTVKNDNSQAMAGAPYLFYVSLVLLIPFYYAMFQLLV